MELPCLAFHHCGRSTELFSASGKTRIIAGGDVDDMLTGKVVCPTVRGFLLVRDGATTATFLFNPRNGEKINLPPLNSIEDRVLMDSHCLLSDEPTVPGCVVLLLEAGDDPYFRYCHPDDEEWVEYEYDIGCISCDWMEEAMEIVICPITPYQGKFYFNPGETEMGVLQFCPEPVFSTMEIDNTIAADGSYGYRSEDGDYGISYLVESDGDLYMVNMSFDARSANKYSDIYRVHVYRMDFARRRWCRVHDLDGRAFLCSLFYFGASCSVANENGLQEDCIYLVYPVRKAVQVFNIREGTNEIQRLDEAPSSDKAFWLLPTISSSSSS